MRVAVTNRARNAPGGKRPARRSPHAAAVGRRHAESAVSIAVLDKPAGVTLPPGRTLPPRDPHTRVRQPPPTLGPGPDSFPPARGNVHPARRGPGAGPSHRSQLISAAPPPRSSVWPGPLRPHGPHGPHGPPGSRGRVSCGPAHHYCSPPTAIAMSSVRGTAAGAARRSRMALGFGFHAAARKGQ